MIYKSLTWQENRMLSKRQKRQLLDFDREVCNDNNRWNKWIVIREGYSSDLEKYYEKNYKKDYKKYYREQTEKYVYFSADRMLKDYFTIKIIKFEKKWDYIIDRALVVLPFSQADFKRVLRLRL